MVHQFLGDATDIDACATKAPGRSLRGWLDKVSTGNLLTVANSSLRSSEAARTSADDKEVIIVFCLGLVYHIFIPL